MKIVQDKRGLTIIEMIVAISIMVILSGAISIFVIRSFYVNRHVIEQGLNLSTLHSSLRNFSADLREARQAEDGNYLFDNCEEYSISFYADHDNDSVVEKLTYSLISNQLQLEIVEPDLTQNPPSYADGTSLVRIIGIGVVNETLTTPLFYYYKEDEEVPLEGEFDSNDVKLVRIRVYANVDIDKAPDAMMLETMVRPRNIP